MHTALAVLLSFMLFGSDIIPKLEEIHIGGDQFKHLEHSFAMTGSGTIQGNIYTYFGDPVKNVKVKLNSNQRGFPKRAKTKSNGQYTFKNLESGFNYQLYPSKTGDELNGVNFYDIQLLFRLLRFGISGLSPYQYIAADINNDQQINSQDLISLVRVLFRSQREFPNNNSWRFVDANFEFFDESNPWPFTEEIQINNLQGNSSNNDFVAIKIGDLSGNARTNLSPVAENRSVKNSSLRIDDFFMEQGKEYTIKLDASGVSDIQGIQLCLDQSNVKIVDISTGLFHDEGSYTYATAHSFKTIWYDRNELADQDKATLFNMQVIPKKSGMLSELLKLDDTDLPSELYTGDKEMTSQQIVLEFINQDYADKTNLSIAQNYPNPFSELTTIECTLDSAGPLDFKVMNISGAVIYSTRINGKKGVNTVNVTADVLGSNGIFHYQFTHNGMTTTKTMIVAK